MNKGFAKILVAVDGSQPSINSAERAISLAKKYGARLTGVFVVSSDMGYGYLDEDTCLNGQPRLEESSRISSQKEKDIWIILKKEQ